MDLEERILHFCKCISVNCSVEGCCKKNESCTRSRHVIKTSLCVITGVEPISSSSSRSSSSSSSSTRSALARVLLALQHSHIALEVTYIHISNIYICLLAS